jgi:predicted DsbA family dithiol-disulfide isomerase
MTEKKLVITIYSDYICPFCYIGFDRIKKLKEQFDFDIDWEPFEIHPETPKVGLKMDELLFPKEYLEMVMTNVKRLADEEGIKFKFSDKLPNSRLALIVSESARKKRKIKRISRISL